jgi:hypothetical protein
VLDEFAHIPSRARPPFVALLAVALALFLGSRLRHDVRYALSPRQPIELGDAATLAGRAPENMPLNRLVRLRGQPERESAVLLDARGSWSFTQFFRLRGSGGRVFVRRVGDPLPIPLAERDQFIGRLVKFQDLSFAESITNYFGNHVSATHFFAPATLAAAIGGGPGPWRLVDRAGEAVALAPADRLALDVAQPGKYLVAIDRAQPGLLARIPALLTAQGASVVATNEAPDRVTITAAIPDDKRDGLLSSLGAQGRGVHFRPARETLDVPASALAPAAGGLQVSDAQGARRSLRFEDIIAARTRAPVQIPPDAVLLLEGEEPTDETKALVFLAFLVGFAAVNLMGLRRAG